MEGTTGERKVRSIQGVRAHEILDSRGNPTVQVYVTTEDGTFEASVPSGASTGAHEAHELRDGDKSRYNGKGVLQAVKNVIEIIGPHLKGKDPTQQREIDQAMNDLDGTENKSRLGANAILGVSLAVARAGAAAKGIPLYRHFADLFGNTTLTLPLPSFNVINGGQHAGNHLAFQEYMIRPVGCATYSEALQVGAEVYHTLRTIITNKYGLDAKNVGDEGGFAPNIKDNREGLELIMAALEKCGHKDKVVLAMDCAASEFYVAEDKSYDLNYKFAATEGSQKMTSAALGAYYHKLIEDYPIDSIEDPFAEDDWEAWSTFSPQVMDRVQIVGDDLTVTSEKRVQRAIDCKAANSVLLKLNQIGTVTECMNAAQKAKSNGWTLFVSHRSGETEDHYLADFAVGINAGQLKTGAPCRSERLSKYNRLLVIEHELGSEACYAPRLTKKST